MTSTVLVLPRSSAAFHLSPTPARLSLPDMHHSCLSTLAPRRLLTVLASFSGDVPAQLRAPSEMSRPGPGSGGAVQVVLGGSMRSPLCSEAVKALSGAASGSRDRGLRLSGAVDVDQESAGQDLGQLVGLPQPLELPILSDAVMLFASIAQARSGNAVYADLSGNPDMAFENVRQAVAFGLSSVVAHCNFSPKQLSSLMDLCDKASMGCLVAPTLSVGSLLLQQAAVSLGFHYSHVDIIESLPPTQPKSGGGSTPTPSGPSLVASAVATELSQIGREYNGGDMSNEDLSRGLPVGDGIRIHSLRQPGCLASLDIRFSAPGQVLSLRMDTSDARAYVPGLLMALRRAPRLKGLVYGLEKLL